MHHSDSPLDIALDYAARGIAVFPCRAGESTDPTTGEVFAPKTPLTPNGLRGATVNERIIREWWKRHPNAMIGVPTGTKLGAWILDLDVKPGIGDGHDWLDDMEAEHGALPETARVRTMGGGTHLFFAHVDGVRNRGGLGQCVDIRGEGGYIIAPGSVAADGRRYDWLDHDGEGLPDIADAPQWLLDLVLPRAPAPSPRHDYTYQPSGTNTAYVERAVSDELHKLATTGQGGRGHQLNASAYALGQIVGAGALDRSTAESQLFDAAVGCGVAAKDGDRETWAKIRRGLDAGVAKPRDIPEATYASHDNTRLVDISRMIANGLAKKKAEEEAPSASPVSEPEADATEADTAPQPDTITATPFTWIDPTTLPRREFAYGTHYIRKYVSVTVSPGGLGKTSNSIAEALSMVSGKPLLGVRPPQRMRVWLFNAEDPRDEMERRIMAACVHYRLKPADIDGLFLDTGREQELVIVKEDKRLGIRIQEPVVESVVRQINQNRIDVLVVDPFVSTHGVNENDNGAIDKVAKLWAQIADRTNCSIDVVHHLRKVSDREATVEDARGAVALIGAARSVRVLNRMSDDQASSAGIDARDRSSYFNVHQGKSNLTKMDTAQTWRKLESVALGNNRGLTAQGDHAGVVTEWRWPSAEEAIGDVTSEQMGRIIAGIRAGDHKAHPASDTWVGREVAYVLGLDLAIKADKARVTRLVKAWIDDGVLTIVNRRCPVKRENKDFVEVAE